MTDFLQQIGVDLREAAGRRVHRRRRSRLIRGTVAACAAAAAVTAWLLAGSSLIGHDQQAANEQPHPALLQIPQPTLIPCKVGAEPHYFVPGDGPSALLGCARLPVSEQPVEFSANLSRIDGADQLCINPAYGQGTFIPSICKLDPPVSTFAIRAAAQPRQGVDGYGYVLWGTVGGARSVVATFDGGVADATRLDVSAEVVRSYGQEPFALFVTELPLSAACGPVTVHADGQTARIGPKPRLCHASAHRPGR